MPENDDEISKITEDQLQKKIKLEKEFKIILLAFFLQISRDVSHVWLSTQSVPSLTYFYTDLVGILRRQYRKIAKVFGKDLQVRSELSLNHTQIANIQHEIIDYIKRHSQVQAGYILNTTESELQRIAQIISPLTTNGELLTNAQIARNIRKEFDAKSDARVNTIAQTETQIASESIKMIEAVGIDGIINSSKIQMIKQWGSILDNRTRASHVDADTQQQPLNKPFEVGGAKLMHPGDTSLGAPLSEICNCRCCSIITMLN